MSQVSAWFLCGCLAALAAAQTPATTSTRPALASTAPAWRFERADNHELPARFCQGAVARPDGSRMTFFLANLRDGMSKRKPLLIYVDGSGAQSHFVRVGDKLGVGLFGLFAERAGDGYHVAAVEKRGVEFAAAAGRPGAGQGASAEYNRHATLADRVADLRRLLDVLLAEPNVDASRVLVVGHSEGADVAAVAASDDPRITHLAFLAGGGPPQFYDFYLTRRKDMRKSGASPEEIEQAVAALDKEIQAILDDPSSEEKFWMGHAYKRWSTFAATSAAEHLAKAKARLFLAHGSEDASVPIESFDYLVFEMIRAGRRDFVARRVPGCDHGFGKAGGPPDGSGMLAMLDEILAWAAK